MNEDVARNLFDLGGVFDRAQLQKAYWEKAKLFAGTPHAAEINLAREVLSPLANDSDGESKALVASGNALPALAEQSRMIDLLKAQNATARLTCSPKLPSI